jgi:hypothetical protein
MQSNFSSFPSQRKHYSWADGPRQEHSHSVRLKNGFYTDANRRWEPCEPNGLWAFTFCRECKTIVACTFLADGSEWLAEIDLDDDGAPVALLHRQHKCIPILVEYENCRWLNGRCVSDAERDKRFAEWLREQGRA